jgi:putative oxidoreductase
MRTTLDDVGKLILRLTLGGLLILHGIHKIQHGIGGIEDLVTAKGLPGFVAYGVYVGEVLAPALLIVGFLTRFAGLAVAINLGVAVWLAHTGLLGQFSRSGGYALELQALYLLGGLALLFLGGGRFSVDGRLRKPL